VRRPRSRLTCDGGATAADPEQTTQPRAPGGDGPGATPLGGLAVQVIELRQVCLICQMDGHFASFDHVRRNYA
jgi:hypothetical protein